MAVAKDQIRQIITENNITSVADVYALLKDSFKDILQELLEAEMDATLGYEKNCKGDLKSDNKRNGHSSKTLKSQYGEFQIDVPRDRNGEFEPKLIPKYQRDISGIEEKVISLYARGMSTRDIHDQLQELYGIELSAEMVSKITDKILPEVKEWQSRPLNPVYPFVFMDCIHYKVREDGRILSRAAYIVLGVTVEGYKEILSITVGYAILVREEFSCLEFIMNRDTINWILKKLNTGGRIWSIYQRKSIKTASATLWRETTTSPIWSCRRKAAPLGGGAGCTRCFCKNTGPVSTMPCFCRENSGHILLT